MHNRRFLSLIAAPLLLAATPAQAEKPIISVTVRFLNTGPLEKTFIMRAIAAKEPDAKPYRPDRFVGKQVATALSDELPAYDFEFEPTGTAKKSIVIYLMSGGKLGPVMQLPYPASPVLMRACFTVPQDPDSTCPNGSQMDMDKVIDADQYPEHATSNVFNVHVHSVVGEARNRRRFSENLGVPLELPPGTQLSKSYLKTRLKYQDFGLDPERHIFRIMSNNKAFLFRSCGTTFVAGTLVDKMPSVPKCGEDLPPPTLAPKPPINEIFYYDGE